MNKKSLLCQYANYKKVVQGKSAAISQNVRLDGLFQNLKKKIFMGFFLYLRGPSSTLCIHFNRESLRFIK